MRPQVGGSPRILSELLLLGHDVAQPIVAQYMIRPWKPPSQTWRTFRGYQVHDIAACDFSTVPTATFRVLYVFIVLRHDRRQVLYFDVTTNPCAQWTAQQITNALPCEKASRFLTRGRDDIIGDYFTQRIEDVGIEDVPVCQPCAKSQVDIAGEPGEPVILAIDCHGSHHNLTNHTRSPSCANVATRGQSALPLRESPSFCDLFHRIVEYQVAVRDLFKGVGLIHRLAESAQEIESDVLRRQSSLHPDDVELPNELIKSGNR